MFLVKIKVAHALRTQFAFYASLEGYFFIIGLFSKLIICAIVDLVLNLYKEARHI